MKWCPRCDKRKPEEEFPIGSLNRSGRESYCRPCKLDYMRDWRFQNKFNITIEQYVKMFDDQEGKCAICKQIPSGKRQLSTLHVDHDHITGIVRGLLCAPCNQALGIFKDSIENLQEAINYLQKHRGAQSTGTRRTLKSVP